jgi:hypothetical protein
VSSIRRELLEIYHGERLRSRSVRRLVGARVRAPRAAREANESGSAIGRHRGHGIPQRVPSRNQQALVACVDHAPGTDWGEVFRHPLRHRA